MSCETIEANLVAYEFGLLEGRERDELESHLLSCGACVRAFVETKRAIEVTTNDAPSPRARAKLRRAVALEVAPSATRVPRKWWETPVAFALAASIVLVASATARAITSGPGEAPYATTHATENFR